jgi:TolA-binding protein
MVAVFGAAAVVLSALISLAAARYTQRQAQAATEASERLERDKVSAQAYEQARKTWEDHVTSLRGQVAELRSRVSELEITEAQCAQRNLDLIRYSRDLMTLLATNGIPHPTPPGGRPF